MARESHLAIVANAFVLVACVSAASRSDESAVISAPTPASREELARVVSAARRAGRVMEKPEQFELVKSASQCVLIHRRTGERHVLTHTTCTRASTM
jgi:hypothetical protein